LPTLQASPLDELDKLLQPADYLLFDLPVIKLDSAETERMVNGQRFRVALSPIEDGRLRMYSSDRQFLGLGRISDGNLLQPERLVAGKVVTGSSIPVNLTSK
jgi:hypothetical protein